MSGAYDARIAAWIRAWDHLEAATKLQEKYPDRDINEVVNRVHRAAEVYAQLAGAPAGVGHAAGSLMAERKETEGHWRRNFEATMRERKDKTGEGVSV